MWPPHTQASIKAIALEPPPPDVLLIGGRLRYNDSLVCPHGPAAAASAEAAACVAMPDVAHMTKLEVRAGGPSLGGGGLHSPRDVASMTPLGVSLVR